MNILRKYTKGVAAFLMLNFLVSIFLPSVSYALTGGPSTPEIASFEPVDTNQMVQMQTGDFTYNIPLIEVPGPSGGYPLSLSYHAGITPNQEASWAGLGWNINPGAIFRSINGYPDDWKNAVSYEHESWVGGTTDRKVYGVNIPIYGVTFSVGVIKTNDTYKGSGTGSYNGVSIGDGAASSGYTVVNDPIGGTSITQQTSVSGNDIGLSSSTSYSSGGISYRTGLTVGSLSVSISSSGNITGASVSGVGVNMGHLNSSGKMTSHTSSNMSNAGQFIMDKIPVIDYSNDRTTYYMDNPETTLASGALYGNPQSSQMNTNHFNDHDYDVYDLFEVVDEDISSDLIYPKYGAGNEIMTGGSLPAYDSYAVSGQGTGGSMKPYDFMNVLYRRNKKNADDHFIVKQALNEFGYNPTDYDAEFMFVGDLSNRYVYDLDESEYFTKESDGTLKYVADANDNSVDDQRAFIRKNNKIGRSSNIEWYTNHDILNGQASDLILPSGDIGRQDNYLIGGYKITNNSGATYHYSLPVYNNEETYVTENIAYDSHEAGDFKTVIQRKEKYAYTWLLTAVTGPDYVRRGSTAENKLGEEDWGYWISFNYGKWASGYKWRSPAVGYNDDLDGNFHGYSFGTKEVYYLNTVSSATHTALFIKSMREDGKGLAVNTTDVSRFEPGRSAANEDYSYPNASLKLDEIILIANEKLPVIDYDLNSPNTIGGLDPNNYSKVLMEHNLSESQYDQVANYSLKRVELMTDYSLMSRTPNSFENENVYTSTPQNSYALSGKLTLNAIQIIGRNNHVSIPPMKFQYENAIEPYCDQCADYWGYYKNDYDGDDEDVNIKRMPSVESVKEVDSWSLNKVVTSVGSELNISYESDEYGESVIHDKVNVAISDMTTSGNGTYNLYFDDLEGELDQYFDVGDLMSTYIVVAKQKKRYYPFYICNTVTRYQLEQLQTVENDVEILAIHSKYITVNTIDQDQEIIDYELPYTVTSSRSLSPVDQSFLLALDIARSKRTLFQRRAGFAVQCVPSNDYYVEHMRDFIGGEVITELDEIKKGGGLRVKSISHLDRISEIENITSYDYTNPLTGNSSGITSFVPFKTNSFKIKYPDRFKEVMDAFYCDDEIQSGGFFTTILKNWEYILVDLYSPLFLKKAVRDIWNFQDRKDLAGFMNVSIASSNDFVTYKRSRLLANLLSKVSEVPTAGVNYQYVTVKKSTKFGDGSIVDDPAYSRHEYIPFTNDMVEISTNHDQSIIDYSPDGDARKLRTQGVKINNKSNLAGRLKSISNYGKEDVLLSKRTLNYLHEQSSSTSGYLSDLEEKDYLGLIDEVSVNARYVPWKELTIDAENDDGDLVEEQSFEHDLVGVVTKKRSFPSFLISEENINYQNDIVTLSENLAFDFYSGSVIKKRSEDGYGNAFISESIPAYRVQNINGQDVYGGVGGMGLVIDGGKNMLTQEAASYTYKVDPNDNDIKQALVSANIQTWGDHWSYKAEDQSWANINPVDDPNPVWRKHRSFSFLGNKGLTLTADGFYPDTDDHLAFDSWLEEESSDQNLWQKNNEITLYDRYSHSLEVLDLNGDYAAIKMDSDYDRVLSTVANASYDEMVFSGAEDDLKTIANNTNEYFGGGVSLGTGEVYTASGDGLDDDLIHTGMASIKANNGQSAFQYTLIAKKTRKVKVSVWSNRSSNDLQVVGNATLTVEKSRESGDSGWYLISATMTVEEGEAYDFSVLSKSNNTYYDDFRVHPVNAAITSYVYNDWGELSFVLDQNNLYTRYEYDEMGRLAASYRESFKYGEKKISSYNIHYTGEEVSND